MKNLPISNRKSDDCVVSFGEEEYKYHEGEEVNFICYLPFSDLTALIEYEEMAGQEDNEREVMKFIRDHLSHSLESAIESWTWTNPRTGEVVGKPVGNGKVYKPTAEDICNFSIDEISYLVQAWFEEASGGTENPNPQ